MPTYSGHDIGAFGPGENVRHCGSFEITRPVQAFVRSLRQCESPSGRKGSPTANHTGKVLHLPTRQCQSGAMLRLRIFSGLKASRFLVHHNHRDASLGIDTTPHTTSGRIGFLAIGPRGMPALCEFRRQHPSMNLVQISRHQTKLECRLSCQNLTSSLRLYQVEFVAEEKNPEHGVREIRRACVRQDHWGLTFGTYPVRSKQILHKRHLYV